MKNTLALTALAIAIAAPSTALATDVKFGGVVQTKLNIINESGNDTTTPASVTDTDLNITSGDVRINANASETVGDLTGFVNVQLNMDTLNAANTFSTDGVHAGISGDFGTFKMGKVDDVNFGRYGNDIQGEGNGSGAALGYTNSFGPVSFGAYFAPEGDADDQFAIGASGSFGPATVGASIASKGDTDTVLFGAEAGLGPVTVGGHLWTAESTSSEKEVLALKVSGAAGAVSWGLTYATAEDSLNLAVPGDNNTKLRLDLGSSLAGLDVGFRFENVAYTDPAWDGISTNNAYIQLGKGF